MKKWWFSVVLGIAYVAVFHAWMFCETKFQVQSIAIGLSSVLFVISILYKKYFYNVWDYFVHASIILDIVLEGTLIYPHDNYYFYGCFIAFAFVLVSLRLYYDRKNIKNNDTQTTNPCLPNEPINA